MSTYAVTGVILISILSLGYLAMLGLLEVRPQFVGSRLKADRREVVQESPLVATRAVSGSTHDYTVFAPGASDVRFDLKANEDWRGLQVVRHLSGRFEGTFEVENPTDEDAHAVFRCPYPTIDHVRSQVRALAFDVEGGSQGELLNAGDGWVWSGRLAPGESAWVNLTYSVNGIRAAHYLLNSRAPDGRGDDKLTFAIDGELPITLLGGTENGRRADLAAHSWDLRGARPEERFGFELREGFGVHDALQRLLQVAPLVTVMFLITLVAVLSGGRAPRISEIVLLSGIYAYYFPLVAYLSARYLFHWAVLIAFAASGLILINYLRFLIGNARGVVLGLLLLTLYQIVPTMMAFSQWDRGMVLLSLGAVGLFSIVNLQTARLKRTLTRGSVAMAAVVPLQTHDLRVSLPAELVPIPSVAPESPEAEARESELTIGLVSYEMTWTPMAVIVEARAPVEVTEGLESWTPLLPAGTFLREVEAPACMQVAPRVTGTRARLLGSGAGELRLRYLAPVIREVDVLRCRIPLLADTLGTARLRSPRPDLSIEKGAVWAVEFEETETIWELGLASVEGLWVTCEADAVSTRVRPIGASETLGEGVAKEVDEGRVYRIEVEDSFHLSVIESDGRLLHFARFKIPLEARLKTFDLRFPSGLELSSLSVDGRMVPAPPIVAGECPIPLGEAPAGIAAREVCLRLHGQVAEVAFIGTWELGLPRFAGTEESIEWTIAPPPGFRLRSLGGAMEVLAAVPQTTFGGYAAAISERNSVALRNILVQQGTVDARLRYVQEVPGLTEELL